MKINYVYASNILPANSYEEMQNLFEIDEQEYFRYLDEEYEVYHYKPQQKRWKIFLNNTNKDEYYFFILTPNMEVLMNKILFNGGDKDLIWKSKYPAVNGNYPKEGPRLTAYLFKGFENTCKFYGVNNGN